MMSDSSQPHQNEVNDRIGIEPDRDVQKPPDGAIEAASDTEQGQDAQPVENLAEAIAADIAQLVESAADDSPGPPEPTESYIHPITGREVYVPKNSRALGPGALISTISLMMFVGGSLTTLMMVARSFDLHGTALLAFVIGSCAVVLGAAGGLLLKTLGDGDKWWLGAGLGGCFGAISAILIYLQTSHHSWWR